MAPEKDAVLSVLGPRELLVCFPKNVKETVEGTKHKMMLKLLRNKNQCKLGAHPVPALKSYLLFYIGYTASLTPSKLFQQYELSEKTY